MESAFLIFIFLLILLIIVAVYILRQNAHQRSLIKSVTGLHRGTPSERELVLELLEESYHPEAIFHDLYIPKKNGNYFQIDLILATPQGLITFEVKDYSGWIFANGRSTYWTQIMAYGTEKYRFYNPIFQNRRHIEELRKISSQFSKIPIFSVVVFYGDNEFKAIENLPDNVFLIKPNQLSQTIKNIITTNPKAIYTNKQEIASVLKLAHSNGDDPFIVNAHIEFVKSYKEKNGIPH